MRTNNYSLLLILIATYIWTTSYTYSQQLMQPYNLDFNMAVENQIPAGWNLSGNSELQGYKAVSSKNDAFEGKFSLEFSNTTPYEAGSWGLVFQKVDAKPLRGYNFKLGFAIKADFINDSSYAQIYAGTYFEEKEPLEFFLQKDTIRTNKEWIFYEISGRVDESANYINYGVIFTGRGKVLLDKGYFVTMAQSAVSPTKPKALTENQLRAYSALAKIFGVIRHFCPTSEAQCLDWDAYLLYSCDEIEKCNTEESIAATLKRLFLPIAPQLRFSDKNDFSKKPKTIPAGALPNVALGWFQTGFEPRDEHTLFKRKIVNVYFPVRESEGAMIQFLDVSPYRGKRIRLSAYARIEEPALSTSAHIRIRIEDKYGNYITSAATSDEPVTGSEWQKSSIVAFIPESASLMKIGLFLVGEGAAYFDQVEISYADEYVKPDVQPQNGDFELLHANNVVSGWKLDDKSAKADYSCSVSNNNPYAGHYCLKIESDPESRINLPEPGETYTSEIMPGLWMNMPLNCYADSVRTLPEPDEKLDTATIKKYTGYILTADDRRARMAAVIYIWNLLRLFHPAYPESQQNIALEEALSGASSGDGEDNFQATLERLISYTGDCHARIWLKSMLADCAYPFLWENADGEIAVTMVFNSFSGNNNIAEGDVVKQINGADIDSLLNDKIKNFAGSNPEWKRKRALAELRCSTTRRIDTLIFQKSDKRTDTVAVQMLSDAAQMSDFRPQSYRVIDDEIIYFDLTKTNDVEFKEWLQKNYSKTYKAALLDLRGITTMSEHVFGFFIDNPLPSLQWRIPVFTAPNGRPDGYKVIRGTIKPKPIEIAQRLYILCDEMTSGYAEAMAAIAQYHGFAKLIGSPTCGSAGELYAHNIRGAISMSLTGILAFLPNGVQIFGEPLKPDYFITNEPADFAKSHYPALDKAIEIIKLEIRN